MLIDTFWRIDTFNRLKHPRNEKIYAFLRPYLWRIYAFLQIQHFDAFTRFYTIVILTYLRIFTEFRIKRACCFDLFTHF